jgi:hypothetical protein
MLIKIPKRSSAIGEKQNAVTSMLMPRGAGTDSTHD